MNDTQEKNQIEKTEKHKIVNDIGEAQKKNIVSRIIMGIIMALILIPCIILGGYYWLALCIFFLIAGTYELTKAPQNIDKKFKPWVYLFSYIMMFSLVFWLFLKDNLEQIYNGGSWQLETIFPMPSLSISCFALNVLFFFILFLIDEKFKLSDVFYFVTIFFIFSLGLQSFLYLRYVPYQIITLNEGTVFKYIGSSLLVFLVFVSAFSNDIGAYFAGTLFGKHKMTRVSPKKTWEGFVGGIIFSLLVTLAFGYGFSLCGIDILPGILDLEHWYNLLIIAIVNPFIGTVGDLLFSAIKRHFEIKDFGTVLKSHGGILDRIDSALLVAISTALLVMIMYNNWNIFI